MTTAQATGARKELPAAESAQAPIVLSGNDRGVMLRTFDELYRYSHLLAQSDFVPKDMRGKPHDVLAAIQLGGELGLPPMASVQNIAVINGRPAVWGDVQLGLCQASGLLEVFEETFTGTPFEDTFTATTTVQRTGQAKASSYSYSVADAKRAKLWNKAGSWSTDPRRMLKYRARAFTLRDAFADVLKGLHTREEMDGYDRDTIIGTPVAVQPTKSRAEQLVDQLAPVAALPEPTELDEPTKKEAEAIVEQAVKIMDGEAEPEPKADEQIGEGPLYQRIAEAYTGLTKTLKDKVREDLKISLVTDCKKMNTAQAAHALAVIADAGKATQQEQPNGN